MHSRARDPLPFLSFSSSREESKNHKTKGGCLSLCPSVVTPEETRPQLQPATGIPDKDRAIPSRLLPSRLRFALMCVLPNQYLTWNSEHLHQLSHLILTQPWGYLFLFYKWKTGPSRGHFPQRHKANKWQEPPGDGSNSKPPFFSTGEELPPLPHGHLMTSSCNNIYMEKYILSPKWLVKFNIFYS